MTKLEKFLSKLVPRERDALKHILEKIIKLDLEGLDIKKIKSLDDVYRVRKGNFRIIFYFHNKTVYIIEASRRNDNTYK